MTIYLRILIAEQRATMFSTWGSWQEISLARLSTSISCLLEVVSTHPAYAQELGTRIHG